MNEQKLKELFGKALDKTVPHTWTSLSHAEVESVIKVFAELIVQECADVGSKFSQAHPEDIRYQIKRHFGVEE